MQKKIPNRTKIVPQAEFHKIEKACEFILDKSDHKSEGLDFEDRDIIEKFAKKMLFD